MPDIAPLTTTAPAAVALFNASDDTVDMVQKLLVESGNGQTLVSCHFADLKKGVIVLEAFLRYHDPEVVIFDLSPPYDENWHFFVTMRDASSMRGRGIVLTTTNKSRLDEVLGADSFALEVVGRAEDLHAIDQVIRSETQRVRAVRPAPQ